MNDVFFFLIEVEISYFGNEVTSLWPSFHPILLFALKPFLHCFPDARSFKVTLQTFAKGFLCWNWVENKHLSFSCSTKIFQKSIFFPVSARKKVRLFSRKVLRPINRRGIELECWYFRIVLTFWCRLDVYINFFKKVLSSWTLPCNVYMEVGDPTALGQI